MFSIHAFTWRAAARLSAAVALGLALGASAVHAQQLTDAQKSAMRSSCRSDYMANCSSVSPGGREALECLEKNMAKLSPACQQAVSAIMPKAPPPAPPPAAAAPPPPAAPRPAAAAPPPPAAPPPAAVAAPPHPVAIDQNALREHCRSDYMAHCSSVPPGGRDALVCLQQNVARLSPACRQVVSATLPHGTAVAAPPRAMPARPPATAVVAPPPPPPAAAPPPEPVMALAKIDHLPLPDRLAIIRACNQDQAALCNGIKPGHSRLIVCLASHPQALSPRCRQTLAQALQ